MTKKTREETARRVPMSSPAQFWAVDLHVHTPASADVLPDRFGATTPEEIVQAALDAELDAIAITDHNTTEWCEQVGKAAEGTPLLVLPGVEINTAEGHVLGVWDVGTESRLIDEVLTNVGIGFRDLGRTEVSSPQGISRVADTIAASGGLTIAAHIDKGRGLLEATTAGDHLKRTLLTPNLAALEITDLATQDVVNRKVGESRISAFVQSSDVFFPGGDTHELVAIGHRRTWIKASRPDLPGLYHALMDPELRIRLDQPTEASHWWIKSVHVHGGFLDGERFEFSSDLNCLLGGTGAGKSLVLELIRFVLDNQTDNVQFQKVREEVDRRLAAALGTDSYVDVVVALGGEEVEIRRIYDGESSPAPTILRGHGRLDLSTLTRVSAFSQGEVIEYAREPVGRLQLVDNALDLAPIAQTIAEICEQLHDNGIALQSSRRQIEEAQEALAKRPEIDQRVADLAKFFEAEVVQRQSAWVSESQRFTDLAQILDSPEDITIEVATTFNHEIEIESNTDLYDHVKDVLQAFTEAIATANQALVDAHSTAAAQLAEINQTWTDRFEGFKADLALELSKVDDPGTNLDVLRERLLQYLEEQQQLRDLDRDLTTNLAPRAQTLIDQREDLIGKLIAERNHRRDLRRERVRQLNDLMEGSVRIRLHEGSDGSTFQDRLTQLARGSRLSTAHIALISEHASPIKLVRSFLAGDTTSVAEATGVPAARVQVLFDHVLDRPLTEEFLDLQFVETDDTLGVQFRKPETEEYEYIENLAHGQKCTAILIISMADGASPLIIDQPEDALHAPWIEEYLVSRLRANRGRRQFVFATRSPGLVVSADAEMIIALEATAERGRLLACGSLERHDLNQQALYHLEGGPVPFKRRSDKLSTSLS